MTRATVLLVVAVLGFASCRSGNDTETTVDGDVPPAAAGATATPLPKPTATPHMAVTPLPEPTATVRVTATPVTGAQASEPTGCTNRSDFDLSGFTTVEDFFDDAPRSLDTSPTHGDFDGDGLPDVATGWIGDADGDPAPLTIHTAAGGYLFAELPLFPGELRTARLIGWTTDVVIASTFALHASSHDVYAVQDCELVRLGPDVPWGSGQSDQQMICLDQTDEGAILSTYYRSVDIDTDEIDQERYASWIIESGTFIETELIERDIRQPYDGCFD